MPRRQKETPEELGQYDRKVAYYRNKFLELGGRTDLVGKPAATVNGEGLQVWNNETVQSFDLFIPKTITIEKTFRCEGIAYYPHDEEKINSQLEAFRQEVLSHYRDQVVDPSPVIPTRVRTKSGRVRNEIFQIWDDCLLVYSKRHGTPAPAFKAIGGELFPRLDVKTAENKASEYFSNAKKCIEQAISGTFPSPVK